MSLAPSYACFGCVEFAHNARTKAYVAWACRTGKFSGDPTGVTVKARSWCVCADDGSDFDNPIDDNACWYDPLIPESADFLGVVITGTTGFRASTYRRELEAAINAGSILGLPRIPGKQIVIEIELVATSQAGMSYGQEWLRRQFEDDGRCPVDGASCASCQGQLLTARMFCPTETSIDDGLHSWAAAGTLDGFVMDEDEFPLGRINCEKVKSGTITIGTERAESYSTNPYSTSVVSVDTAFRNLGNCFTSEDALTFDDLCCPICPGTPGCDPCTTDPGCDCIPPFVLTPEVMGETSPCFTDPLCRCIKAVGITDVPAGYETALRMTVQAGYDGGNPVFQRFGMRNLVIRVFENPSSLEVPTTVASYEALTAAQLPCAEIGVSWMPKGSELVIDGLSGRVWLKCNGQCVDHSDRVHTITGSLFPLKARCTELIVTAEWDCLNSQGVAADGKVVSSLTIDAFLGFK